MTSHPQPQNTFQELIKRSSLDDLEMASSIAHVSLSDNNVALSKPLPDSIHEHEDAEPLTASRSPAELSASASSSSEGRNPLGKINEFSSERRNPTLDTPKASSKGRMPSISTHEYSTVRRSSFLITYKVLSEIGILR